MSIMIAAPSPARPGYHHGDLQRALVEAAIAILGDTQRWDFSLREVARRAGVSHNAPYAHFADKRGLLAGVAAAGYETLRERMITAQQGRLGAGEALDAIGAAYIQFGLKNPAHYRLMFGQELRSAGGLPDEVLKAAEASRAVLRDVIRRGAEEGSFDVDLDDPASLVTAVLAAWTMVHGFTLLAIDGLASLETSLDLEELARLIAGRFMAGLARRPGTNPAQSHNP